MKRNILMLLLFIATTAVSAQSKKTEEVSFWVAGVCGMCEKTIENALDVKGVVAVDYDLKTHQVHVVFKSAKISVDQMHVLLNEAGYDTEKSNCSDAQYNRVHGCCKYRDLKDH